MTLGDVSKNPRKFNDQVLNNLVWILFPYMTLGDVPIFGFCFHDSPIWVNSYTMLVDVVKFLCKIHILNSLSDWLFAWTTFTEGAKFNMFFKNSS